MAGVVKLLCVVNRKSDLFWLKEMAAVLVPVLNVKGDSSKMVAAESLNFYPKIQVAVVPCWDCSPKAFAPCGLFPAPPPTTFGKAVAPCCP